MAAEYIPMDQIDPAIRADLESFDSDFAPAPPSQYREDYSVLPDGIHDFTVLDAAIRQAKGYTIFELGLRSDTSNFVCKRSYFMKNADDAARIGGDLLVLGFPTNTWNAAHGKKFSAELIAAIPKLGGQRFKASIKTNTKDPQYKNMFINSAIAPGTPVSPAKATPPMPSAPVDPFSTPANPLAPIGSGAEESAF